jgi:hypothetical protein
MLLWLSTHEGVQARSRNYRVLNRVVPAVGVAGEKRRKYFPVGSTMASMPSTFSPATPNIRDLVVDSQGSGRLVAPHTKDTGLEVGQLINFSALKVEFKRFVLSNQSVP